MDNILETNRSVENLTKDNAIEISIEVLKKTVNIRCPKEQEQGLLLAADQLEKRLHSMGVKNKIWNRDAILAITALNLMNEVIGLKQELAMLENQENSIKKHDVDQINSIIKKIDAFCCN